LIFRDVRLDRGQLGHLMPARLTDVRRRLQPVLAMLALTRLKVHHPVDAIRGNQLPPMPRMPRCPPGLRRLFCRRPRSRCLPASPSDDGGLEVVVEFC
jgi:hypothetical protein